MLFTDNQKYNLLSGGTVIKTIQYMEPMIAYLYVYLDEAVEADTDGTFLKNFPLPNNIFRRLRASVDPWAQFILFCWGFFLWLHWPVVDKTFPPTQDF